MVYLGGHVIYMHLKNLYVLQFLCVEFCKCQLCQNGSIFKTCVLIDSCLLGILINEKDVKNLWLCLWICLFLPLVLSVFVSLSFIPVIEFYPVTGYLHCYVFLVNCLFVFRPALVLNQAIHLSYAHFAQYIIFYVFTVCVFTFKLYLTDDIL